MQEAISGVFARCLELERRGMSAAAQAALAAMTGDIPLDVAQQLAFCAVKRGDLQSATNYFYLSFKKKPGDPYRRAGFGAILLRANRPDQAIRHLAGAEKKLPFDRSVLQNLTNTCLALGRVEHAFRFAERLLARYPEDPEVLLTVARLYDVRGEAARAKEIYDRAIRHDPGMAEAYDGWARAESFRSLPDMLHQVLHLLEDNAIPARKRFILHLVAAKILDDVKEFDSAFEHLVKGNAARTALPFEEISNRYEAWTRTFSREFFQGRSAYGVPSQRPIFVFGMPRSGTTLVEQILASHPQIFGAGELFYFDDVVRQRGLTSQGSLDWATALTPEDAVVIGEDYLQLLEEHSSRGRHVVDKMPMNFEHLWLIALIFPYAKYIHCVRDPIETCLSCFATPLSRLRRGDSLSDLGRYYRLYEKLMGHWQNVLPVKIFSLSYERLVASPTTAIGELLDYVGVSRDHACFRPEENRRPVSTPSRNQVRSPITDVSIKRWSLNYAQHLEPLRKALIG